MRREEQEYPSTRSTVSIHEASSKSSSHGYVHSTISPNLQCSISDLFMKRNKGGVPKKETLGEYLQEYEAQYKELKDNLKFQGFSKIKEDGSTKGKQHGMGRFFLSTFYGSPKCLVRVWVEKLDNFV